jgi:hypothetical protein
VASSTSLLPQVAERVEQVTLLREHAPLGRVRQELYRVEAQAATLLGRLVWDVSGQRDHATAARYYDQAIAAGSKVKEGWAEAFPRMFQRFNQVLAASTDLRTGLELAERASARAQDGSSHVVAGWSLAFTAEAHALLGEERKAKQRSQGHGQPAQPLAIAILRLHGARNIAAALRRNARDGTDPSSSLASPAHEPDIPALCRGPALEPARLRCGVDTPACGEAATGGRDEVGIEQPASGLEDASDLGQRLRPVGNVVGRLVGVDEVELVVSEGKVGGFGDLEAHATGPARSSRTASSSNDPTNQQAVTLTPHDTLIHRS